MKLSTKAIKTMKKEDRKKASKKVAPVIEAKVETKEAK
jgi:hypothetical protein